MKTVAVVPVKSLSQAKSRLANILSPEERALLVLDMLSHVLGTFRSSPEIDEVAVISPQPSEFHLPSTIVPIVQAREGLNDLLEQGREWAIERGADALLVLFADLPLISPGDISAHGKAGQRGWHDRARARQARHRHQLHAGAPGLIGALRASARLASTPIAWRPCMPGQTSKSTDPQAPRLT